MYVLLVVILVHLISSALTNDSVNETLLTNSQTERSGIIGHFRLRRSFYTTVDPLYCPPCPRIHCYKHRKKRLQCKGGYTVGICGCCRVCAKVENEQCGGEHNYLGRCDKELVCEPQPPTEVSFLKDGVRTVYRIQKGVCKKTPKNMSPDLYQCKPKCDPNYCNKNPRAICSAVENAEKLNQCQDSCQHTSCRACRFVESELHCPKCAQDDFKCIKNFGRCIRKKICKPKTYPCGNHMSREKSTSKFICAVPECV